MSDRIKNLIYFVIYFTLFSVTIVAFLRESWVTFFLALITIGAIFGLRFFFRRSSIVYPKEIEIALVLFVGISFILDELSFVSTHALGLDIIKHVISGALFGLIAFVLVYALNHFHKESLKLSAFFVALFSFTFSITFSFLWIVFENIIETLAVGGGVHDGNVINQLWTLASVIIGAMIIAVAGYQYLQYGINNVVGRMLNKFFSANPAHQAMLKSTKDDTMDIIAVGETQSVEFKSTLRMNLHTNKKDKKIEHASLKTICAFLNSAGGILFIGINDDKKVMGITEDEFANNDKFQLHFTNIFNQHIGEQFSSSISTELINIEDKYIFRVDCFRSKTPVFLRSGEKEEFYIRMGAATQELRGSKLVKYISKNFV
ncbi:MAG: ATP-binding protein [Patescibacteria group bacterium]|nr:ATP-binding protein [Patescibacteria group bacterium]